MRWFQEQLLDAARRKLAEGKHKPSTPAASQELSPPKSGANAAPGRAFEIIRGAGDSSIDESLAMEVDAISELGATEATQKVMHAAVIGAGVMGSGIAQWLSSRGVSVILRDVDSAAIDRGLANIDKIYGDAVKRGLMSEEKAKEGRARIV